MWHKTVEISTPSVKKDGTGINAAFKPAAVKKERDFARNPAPHRTFQVTAGREAV
jgi:hypothetical protein